MDQEKIFNDQFKPVEGGYLYFPSIKSGGKLGTHEEYQMLRADWERVYGRSAIRKVTGLIIVAVVLWLIVREATGLPVWTESFSVAVCVIGLLAWFWQPILKRQRLVRGRPDAARPRDPAVVRREVRSLVPWRVIITTMLICGSVFVSTLSRGERTLEWWVWLIGSGSIFLAYVWLAIRRITEA